MRVLVIGAVVAALATPALSQGRANQVGTGGGGVAVGIGVGEATYGGNCGAAPGNTTQAVASVCNGQLSCSFAVDAGQIGDPVPGCAKDFQVQYSCSGNPNSASLAPEAHGQSLALSCQ